MKKITAKLYSPVLQCPCCNNIMITSGLYDSIRCPNKNCKIYNKFYEKPSIDLILKEDNKDARNST